MTTAKRVKDAKIEAKFQKARDDKEQRPKFSTRKHNRCKICGRPRAYLRKFGLCRRELRVTSEVRPFVRVSMLVVKRMIRQASPPAASRLRVPSATI